MVKVVLCSCTVQWDALHFDQQSCLICGPQFTYHTTVYTSHVTPAEQLWVCSHALV